MKGFRLLQGLAATAMLVGSAISAHAYPSGLNLIPTADIIGSGNVRIAYESDGHDKPLQKDDVECIYTEFGVGSRLELGIDTYDLEGSSDQVLNAKYLVTTEKANRPAFAIGVYNVGKGYDPIYFGTALKSDGRTRVHLGVQRQDRDVWLQLGADYALTKNVSILSDFQRGPARYTTLGLYWQATPSFAASLYAARTNSRNLKEGDYTGLYAQYVFHVK